jgi:hypothetical protein
LLLRLRIAYRLRLVDHSVASLRILRRSDAALEHDRLAEGRRRRRRGAWAPFVFPLSVRVETLVQD